MKILNPNEVKEVVKKLFNYYKNVKYYLNFNNIDQLFVLVILSAQTKDETVNKLAPQLFSKYKTINDFAHVNVSELKQDIKSINFAGNKAKNIINAAKIIEDKYNSKVPGAMLQLLQLPGIGRKSANVILINGFNIIEGIPVDTWVIKLSNRIGISINKDPDKIEQDLKRSIEKKYWGKITNILKQHGKEICRSIPLCSKCHINSICKKNGVVKYL